MKQLFMLSLLIFLLDGCAVMNTFQTPKTKEPGEVSIGVGGGYHLGERESGDKNINTENRYFEYPIVPFDVYLRVGIIPRVDLGLRTAGFVAYGADLKYQILKTFPVSVSAGFGSGLYGYDISGSTGEYKSTTKFIGLIAEKEPFYYGVKLTDYYYREKTDGQSDGEENGLFPALTVGVATPETTIISPLFEINGYFVPEFITTVNVGLKVNF